MEAVLHNAPELRGLLWIAAALFGAVVGSFLNVVIWGLPREGARLRPGSHCPACGAPIRWFDNVPLLSWLLLLGRCRACREKISARYPLIELFTALLSLAVFYRFGASWYYFLYFAFAAALLAASAIDLEHRI